MRKTRSVARSRKKSKTSLSQRLINTAKGSSRLTKIIFILIFAALGSYLLIASKAEACTQTLGPEDNIALTVQNAPGGSTICLSAGNYPSLALQGQHTSDVILTNVPGAKVTVGAGSFSNRTALTILPNSSHIVVRNLYLSGGVQISADKTVAATYITIDHNDIAPIGMGINAGSVNCEALNGPTYDGCVSRQPIRNITISGNRIKYPKTSQEYGMEALAKYGFSGICDLSNPTCVQARDEGNIQQDALHFNNYDNLKIIGNEITNTVIPASGSSFWTAAHNDCFQSVYGGSNLVFDHNYEHDNNCQGFFIKDGDVTNVSYTNNLLVRNRVNNAPNKGLQAHRVRGFVERNNTNWGAPEVLRSPTVVSPPYDAVVDHNVITNFNNGCCGESKYALTENNNIFGSGPFTFTINSTSAINASPQFVDPTKDDYRLLNNPNGIGVNWKPSDYVYGPIGIGSTPTPEPTPVPEPTPIPTPEPTPTPEPPASDTAHPSVTIKSPLNGVAVNGTVNISASATDNVGVTNMSLYIDGKLYSSSTTGTILASWNTKPKRVTKGAHIITVNATDAAGNTSSATVTVNVTK